MAKRSFYKQGLSGRQVVLYVIVGAVVIVAAVKLVFSHMAGDEQVPPDEAAASAAGNTERQEPEKPMTSGTTLTAMPKTTSAVKPEPAKADASVPAVRPAEKPAAPEMKPAARPQTDKLLSDGFAAVKVKKYLEARELLSRAVALGLEPEQEKVVRELLNEISDIVLFSRNIYAQDVFCDRYKVKSGDRLSLIAKRFSVPYPLLMRINGIKDAKNLRAGETIKVVKGPFHGVVDKSEFRLSVYLGEVLVRSYPVSIGAEGRDTPTGLWVVQEGKKQKNPAWTDPDTHKHYYPNDPENPLGDRWIGLEGVEGNAVGRTGFGLHGTIKPEEIGKRASRGCIRLLNEDVIELYDLLVEGKSKVRVID